MFTPQQIEQISFSRATFGGYDMQSVDEFLEPLTEDYITLYKENALLKSKMRILVSKLEEYRKNEASMKEAIATAQNTCDLMVKEAESKCALMLSEANLAAAESTRITKAQMALEEDRVEEARRTAAAQIEQLQRQLTACLDALEYIKVNNRPTTPVTPQPVQAEPVKEPEQNDKTKVVADEISQNLAAMIGETEDAAPTAEPKHPTQDATTKFTGLKFGPNYDPTK
jgi:cell division initiation protein